MNYKMERNEPMFRFWQPLDRMDFEYSLKYPNGSTFVTRFVTNIVSFLSFSWHSQSIIENEDSAE